jgi:hypothetical protein
MHLIFRGEVAMEISVIVCNVCQDRVKPTRRYEVRREDRSGEVDLCEEDAAPIEASLAGPPAVRKRARGLEVRTLEEVKELRTRS